MTLVFATNNKHKLTEVKKMMPPGVHIATLSDIGCTEELPETGNTFEHNAAQKARYVYDKYGLSCFADDSGLEVATLDGRPGVFSARYSGSDVNHSRNIRKLLTEMKGEENRKAQFRTVIALYLNADMPVFFSGAVSGSITTEEKGSGGFGYDPVFIPDGFINTFAEMTMAEKNRLSHRAEAVKKLVEYLKEKYGPFS